VLVKDIAANIQEYDSKLTLVILKLVKNCIYAGKLLRG
jgi:hypothetical protein